MTTIRQQSCGPDRTDARQVARWEAAWENALNALEVDASVAEQMLSLGHIAQDPPAPWSPPVGLGLLPAALQDRAQALLDRQIELSRRLTDAARLTRQHSRAVRALRSGPPAVPVYLDVPA